MPQNLNGPSDAKKDQNDQKGFNLSRPAAYRCTISWCPSLPKAWRDILISSHCRNACAIPRIFLSFEA